MEQHKKLESLTKAIIFFFPFQFIQVWSRTRNNKFAITISEIPWKFIFTEGYARSCFAIPQENGPPTQGRRRVWISGRVSSGSMPFEGKGFPSIPGILSGIEIRLPTDPPCSDEPVTLLYWFFILRSTMKNSLPEVGHLQDSMRWSFDKICWINLLLDQNTTD